jgi:8-oxo-dGTP pyrophosphatase MutT (NUDIX family)
MRFAETIARLERLPEQLPEPPEALRPMLVVEGHPVPPDAGPEARDAAVLVLLYPGPDAEAWTVLTARPTGDLRHAGEVSFPGGAVEPGDRSITAAALREAREEVGLDPAQCGLRVLGELGPVDVRVSGFRLHPVLAAAERRPFLQRDPREVSAIIEVPVRTFLVGAPITVVEEERSGWHLRYGAYPVGDYRVWGATARVLGQVGALLAAAGGTGPR